MKKNSVLWRVENSKRIGSYVFGTMHVRDEHAFKHLDKALKAMSYCSHFRTEIDLDDARGSEIQQHYLLPGEVRLSDLINPRKFDKMCRILRKAFKVDLHALDRYKPVMTLNILSESLLNESHSLPLDHHLWNEAISRSMHTGGIETVERQIGILNSLPLKPQIRMLKDLCRNPAKFKKGIQKIKNLYVKEDIQGIFRMSKKSMGEFRKLMIYQRNADMANCISEYSNEPCMYAIGAAHLGGQKGVISYLKKKGFKVQAIH
ncbi:MAG: TraB/GumN family protein [Saprospiraceae bacterium]|nr:TraB/GumN family protein [Saprospiraceae bacterium]